VLALITALLAAAPLSVPPLEQAPEPEPNAFGTAAGLAEHLRHSLMDLDVGFFSGVNVKQDGRELALGLLDDSGVDAFSLVPSAHETMERAIAFRRAGFGLQVAGTVVLAVGVAATTGLLFLPGLLPVLLLLAGLTASVTGVALRWHGLSLTVDAVGEYNRGLVAREGGEPPRDEPVRLRLPEAASFAPAFSLRF